MVLRSAAIKRSGCAAFFSGTPLCICDTNHSERTVGWIIIAASRYQMLLSQLVLAMPPEWSLQSDLSGPPSPLTLAITEGRYNSWKGLRQSGVYSVSDSTVGEVANITPNLLCTSSANANISYPAQLFDAAVRAQLFERLQSTPCTRARARHRPNQVLQVQEQSQIRKTLEELRSNSSVEDLH